DKYIETFVYPHNLLLHLLVEGGLLLTIPFILILMVGLWLIIKSWNQCSKMNHYRYLILLVFIISVPRLILSSYFCRDQAFWMLIFLSLNYLANVIRTDPFPIKQVPSRKHIIEISK